MSKRMGWAAAALVAAAAIAAGWVLRAGHRPRSDALAGVQGAPSPGAQRRWALSFEVRLEQPGRSRPVAFTLTGDWVRTVSAASPSEYDVALEIEGARITGGDAPGVSAADVEALRRRLERRFWVTYGMDGAAVRVHFPKEIEPGDRNLLQMIATETQLVRPPAGALQWTAVERDGAGSYLAGYQRSGDRIAKRKLRYIDARGAAGAAPPGAIKIDVGASEHVFTLDGGEIATAEGTDRMQIDLGMPGVAGLVVRTSTRLSAPRVGTAPALAGSLERARATVLTAPIRSHAVEPEALQAQQDASLLEGRSTESVLADALSKQADPALPARLAALFRRRPEAIPTAAALVRDGNEAVLDGLAAAATPASLDALSRTAHDRSVATPARVRALGSLVLVQRPSAAAMRIPLDLLDDGDAAIRRAARLMAGALARAGRAEHAAEAAALDAALVSRLAAATTAAGRAEVLAALGNGAGPQTLGSARGALSDPSPEVRAAAVRALRLCQAPEVDPLIGATMTGDREPRVRSAALFAAAFRAAGSFLAAAERAALLDAVDYVRSDAVGLLRKHLDEPSVRETLSRVAEHDPKPAIRRLAREALAQANTR